MFIREAIIHEFRNLKGVHLGPFAPPTAKSDIVVLAGANGGGKSSILEVTNYALSNAFGYSYANRRSMPTRFHFEVCLGLTSDEIRLIRQYLETDKQYAYQRETLEQLVEKRQYVRHFYQNVQTDHPVYQLYDNCHSMVSHILRGQLHRPMGFFLKSDRFYPIEGFKWRDRLFEYEQMSTREHIWGMGFTNSDNQYRDMFDFLVQMRFHYFRQLGEYHDALSRGEAADLQLPTDPILPYEKMLRLLLPGYTFGRSKEKAPSNLFIQLPNKDVIPFHDLSSGEKEVFFLLSFFIRHGVEHSVISIDEPELHLHPEFARRLVRLMLSVQPGNQIWLATHNGEIIDEAGRDKTYYIGRGDEKTDVVHGSSEPEAAIQLRTLFGVSGYIGIARNMVFLEGEGASADRKTFGWLFGEEGGSVKLIPAGGVDNQTRINAAVLAILESTFGVCQFFLIRDRDYLTAEMVDAYVGRSRGRIHVLRRNQIENYLLDADLISRVLNEHFDIAISPSDVDQKLLQLCRQLSGEVLRDMTSFRLNMLFRPQDFSLGKFLENTPIFDADNNWLNDKIAPFEKRIGDTGANVAAHMDGLVKQLPASLGDYKAEIQKAVTTDTWRSLFPGKRLLEEFARANQITNQIGLVNALIKEMAASKEAVHSELLMVREAILSGQGFSTDH